MSATRCLAVIAVLGLLACGGGSTTSTADLALPSADGYCEATVQSYCAFYLRCGRMAVSTVEACRAAFLETCNARFEPRYVDLERAGLITLSAAGIASCASHLATVACEEQLLDLDGPCGAMWIGTQAAGAPCGLDVESFVCGPGTYCRLDLSLCGACETGTSSPTPRDYVYVAEGEACDADHRCPYLTSCVGGTCRRSALLDEACSATTTCSSGRCLDGTCQPLAAEGGACSRAAECSSGLCDGGTCHALPSACIR